MDVVAWIIVAFAPGLFWLSYVRHRDDLEPEPRRCLLWVFALGVGSAFLVTAVGPWFASLKPADTGWFGQFVDAFLVVAVSEELMKALAFFVGAFWLRELDEPLDGLVYGVAAGLGFASIENWFYLELYDRRLDVLLMRSVTATLMHMTCSGAVGFFLGLVWFTQRVHPLLLVMTGFALAVAMHGTYDFCLMVGGWGYWFAVLGVLPTGLVLFGVKLRWARARSPLYHGQRGGPDALQ